MKKIIGVEELLLRCRRVAIIGVEELLLRCRKVAIRCKIKNFFTLFTYNCHINIGGVKYGKKIKLSIIRNSLYR